VLAFDGAMNGIDAQRALSIVRDIRDQVQEAGTTAVFSLESPTPEVMGLFDNIVVLAEGQELYHGPSLQRGRRRRPPRHRLHPAKAHGHQPTSPCGGPPRRPTPQRCTSRRGCTLSGRRRRGF